MAESTSNEHCPPLGHEEDFIEAIDEDLQCLICQYPLKEPVQTRCGHRYCKGCLDENIRSQRRQGQSLTCPSDRQKLDLDRVGDIFSDKATGRKILSLKIRCPNDGCEWTGELGNKEAHLESCPYQQVHCGNNNCQERVQRRHFKRHENNECPWRIVQCAYCSEPHPECKMQEHIKKCIKFPVTCPIGCGLSIPREMVSSHTKDECPRTIISCPYSGMGCETQVQRQEEESHLTSATMVHLDLAYLKLKNTDDKLNKTEDELNNTKDKLKKTEDQLRNMDDKLKRTEDELKNQDANLKKMEDQLKKAEEQLKATEDRLKNTEDKLKITEDRLMKTDHKLKTTEDTLKNTNDKLERTEANLMKTDDKLKTTEGNLKNTNDKLERTEANLMRTDDKLKTTNDVLKNTKDKLKSTEDKLKSTDVKLKNTNDKLMSTDNNLKKTEDELKNTNSKLNETRADLKKGLELLQMSKVKHTNMFVWRIDSFSEILRQSKNGVKDNIESEPFYTKTETGGYGYKLKIGFSPNGISLGRNTHVSVLIIVMKGDYDVILPWPIEVRVKLTLIDQQENSRQRENETFVSYVKFHSFFDRPMENQNIGLSCAKFISHEKLNSRRFIVDDTLFLQVEISSPSSQFHTTALKVKHQK